MRQAIDIVDLVGSYIQLRRQGRNFVGLCPWHDDSRPSLQVNPERQSFKCWVCDIGGDVFSFVMKAEGHRVSRSAGDAGRAGRHHAPAAQSRRERSRRGERSGRARRQAHAASRCWPGPRSSFTAACSLRPKASRPRSISPSAASRPKRSAVSTSALRPTAGIGCSHEPAASAVDAPRSWSAPASLIRRDTGDGYYDRFRGRVMFSIRDAHSRPIAFGGRVLPQLADERIRQIHQLAGDAALLQKPRALWPRRGPRQPSRERGAIVMEGYTDCLMAQQNGLDNVVAVLGTALGERHLQVLRRYTDSITLVLDGDDAGRRRTNEILDALLALFEKNQIDLADSDLARRTRSV